MVPYDTGAWMTTDPETLLPTDLLTVGAWDVRGIQAAKARYEFVEHDFNHFVELDRSGRSVATLRRLVGQAGRLAGALAPARARRQPHWGDAGHPQQNGPEPVLSE